jgi:hypothetical protein
MDMAAKSQYMGKVGYCCNICWSCTNSDAVLVSSDFGTVVEEEVAVEEEVEDDD